MDETFSNAFNLYINGVASIVLIFLGLFGNILTVITLAKCKATSPNTFLIALAVWDSVVLVSSLCLHTLPELSDVYSVYVTPYVMTYVYPIQHIAQSCVTWLTVAYTVVRYIAVAHPLRTISVCTVSRAKLAVISVSIIAGLFNACRWFEFQIVSRVTITGDAVRQDQDRQNYTDRSIGFKTTPFGRNSAFRTIFYLYLNTIIMIVLPVCMLLALTVMLIIAVLRAERNQRSLNVSSTRQRNIIKMLVSIALVFKVCRIPSLVNSIHCGEVSKSVIHSATWNMVLAARQFCIIFSSSMNCIIYCVFVRRIRSSFVQLIAKSKNYGHKSTVRYTTHVHQTVKVRTAASRSRFLSTNTVTSPLSSPSERDSITNYFFTSTV